MNTNKVKSFYKNKRILITGETGFKGSWLSFWMSSFGAQVQGYSLGPTSDTNLYTILKLKDKISSVNADILDSEKLESEIERFKPEFVFHLAAQALVRKSYEQPISTFETNVIGTIKVLEAVRKTKSVQAIIIVTSDKCYAHQKSIKSFEEEDKLGGADPYSASKACAEIATQAYRNSFFGAPTDPKIASVRAGNVIGGGDWGQDRLIPDIVTSLNNKKSVVLRNPSYIRPWQHVLEPLWGYLLLGMKITQDKNISEGAWNFGPNKSSEVDVQTLSTKFINIWGQGNLEIAAQKSNMSESKILKLNSAKAKNTISWVPRLSFDESLNLTVNWYKDFYQNKDMSKTTTQQLSFFERKLDEL